MVCLFNSIFHPDVNQNGGLGTFWSNCCKYKDQRNYYFPSQPLHEVQKGHLITLKQGKILGINHWKKGGVATYGLDYQGKKRGSTHLSSEKRNLSQLGAQC